jgi:hypothetical protein
MMIVGIDPGQDGAIAFIRPGSSVNICDVHKMPLSGKGVDCEAICKLITMAGNVSLAVVECVHSMPKQGVSSSFQFGRTLGRIEGVIRTLRIPLAMPTPQAWKKLVLAGTKKDKDAAIDYVRRMYPSAQLIQPGCRVPDHNIADSVCLAEFGRLMLHGGGV